MFMHRSVRRCTWQPIGTVWRRCRSWPSISSPPMPGAEKAGRRSRPRPMLFTTSSESAVPALSNLNIYTKPPLSYSTAPFGAGSRSGPRRRNSRSARSRRNPGHCEEPMTDTKSKKLSLVEQVKLDSRLIEAARKGNTETVSRLLAGGANVHALDDWALDGAAKPGYTETVKVLLAYGADVHADDDNALCGAAHWGHMETVRVLARHIFAADSWRGKSRTEIEAYAAGLYDKIKTE